MNNVQLAGNHAVYIRVNKLLLEFECRSVYKVTVHNLS